MAYAGFWMRVIAYLIDTILVQIVVYAVNFAILVSLAAGGSSDFGAALAMVLGVVIGLGYWAGLESSARQATVGKMIVGIKVTDTDGNRITFGRALGRNLAKLLSTVILLIGYLMVAFTQRKQGLHDLIAGTVVVYR